MLFWTNRFPGLFVGLLHPDLDKRKANIANVQTQFQLLHCLMPETASSKFAQDFFAGLQWPPKIFCMELLYVFAEIKFDHNLTDDIVPYIRGPARSL